jgi:hypothetical protein
MTVHQYPTDFSSLTWSDLPSLSAGDTVDGGGATFTSLLTPPTNGSAGSPITWQNFTSTTASGSGVFMNKDYQTFDNVTLDSCAANGMAISAAAETHTNLIINNCNFSNNGTDGLRWLVSVADRICTLTDITVTNSTFNGNGESGFHVRVQDNAHITSIITRLTMTGNTANNNGVFGFRVQGERINSALTPPTATVLARSVDLTFNSNNASGNGAGSSGGGMTIQGFGSSASAYGTVEIKDNISSNNNGPAGGLNVFYHQYARVYNNICNGNTSTTIDANGILIDHENDEIQVYNNVCHDNVLALAVNAGCGIMILDSTNVDVWGNWCDGNNNGLFVGGNGVNQVAYSVTNNTFTNCVSRGMYLDNQFDQANELIVKNNVFTGVSGGTHTGIEEEATPTTWAEDYNYVNGFTTLGVTLGSNSSTDEPDIDTAGRPTATSPLTGAGTTTIAPATNDFEGYPFRSAPSIGAYEDSAKTFYVQVNGSAATGDVGTVAAPWDGESSMDWTQPVGGDTVRFLPGTYNEQIKPEASGTATRWLKLDFTGATIDGQATRATCLTANAQQYIHFYGGTFTNATGDNVIQGAFSGATADSQLYENMTMTAAGDDGIAIASTDSALTNITIKGCYITSSDQHGIYTRNSQGILITNCLLDGNGVDTQTTANADGIALDDDSINSVIEDCTILNQGTANGAGIDIQDSNGTGTTYVRRCTVRNPTGVAFTATGPATSVVYWISCLSIGGVNSFLGKLAATNYIYNCTLVNASATAVRLGTSSPTGGDITINNTVITGNASHAISSFSDASVYGGGCNNNHFDAGTTFVYEGAASTDLAGWRTASSQDANSIEGNPQVSSPEYLTEFSSSAYRAGIVITGLHDTVNNGSDSWGDKPSIGLDDNGYSRRRYIRRKYKL